MAKVNRPNIVKGLTPIIYDNSGNVIDINELDSNWYAYTDQGSYGRDGMTSRWANARTEDGSQWVWIPRYAYKITNPGTNTASEIDIIFLSGKSNKYEDENGNMCDLPEGYIVHPVFTNEEKEGYPNGGWDKEVTGIWVAKYQAGFAGGGNNVEAVESNVINTASNINKNFYGTVDLNTKFKYPVFLPLTYAYNNINVGDAYALSQDLNSENNPYGLINNSYPHLMKKSEWGCVAYLAHSKYGRNGIQVSNNKRSLNNNPSTIFAVTGCGASDNTYFNDRIGQASSTTGNIYGIFDMHGTTWEMVAGYLECDSSLLIKNAKLMVDIDNDSIVDKKSTKYVSMYKRGENVGDSQSNYLANKDRKGEAMFETSSSGNGNNSWFGDYSRFLLSSNPFFKNGGYFDTYQYDSGGGLFSYAYESANAGTHNGFRCVLIPD